MDSFLTPAQKAELEAPIANLHATFARPLYLYKQAKEVVVFENPDHNFIFETAPTNSEVVITQVSGIFSGRVAYAYQQRTAQFNSPNRQRAEDQININLEEGTVRLKLDPSGSAFIEDALRVKLDGDIFEIVTNKRPHGLFDPKWYTFTLKRLN